MTARRFFAGAALLALILAPAAIGADEKAKGAVPPEMEASMKLAAPGDHHKHLAAGIGKWDVAVKLWMAPGQPPAESTGTMESSWLLGGRFVETTYKGDLMGMPFEGHGVDGYDNGAHQYVSTWADNMGTMMMYFTGTCSDDGKVRTMTADFTDPVTGQKMKNRSVTTVKDASSFTYEAWMVDGEGHEFKQMEMVAARR